MDTKNRQEETVEEKKKPFKWVNLLLIIGNVLAVVTLIFFLTTKTGQKVIEPIVSLTTETQEVAYDNTPYEEWEELEDPVEIPILMYHAIHVMDESEAASANLIVDPDTFESHVKRLKDEGYYFLSPEEAHYALTTNSLPQEKVVWLTFDDGNADFYDEAYPILKKYHAKATNNIITGFTEDGIGLTIEEMLEMKEDGMSFQSHTVTHPDLSATSKSSQQTEMGDALSYLNLHLTQGTMTIAYPSGRYSDTTLEVVKDYYQLGLTTNEGLASLSDGLHTLDRVRILPTTTADQLMETLNNYASSKTAESQAESIDDQEFEEAVTEIN